MSSFFVRGSFWKRPIFLLPLFLLFLNGLSYAHRVNIFAWFDGERVNGRAYYSNGVPAKEARIEVFSREGKRLCSLKTNSSGRFSFRPKGEEKLKIVLDAGMGHRATAEISVGSKAKRDQRDFKGNIHPLTLGHQNLSRNTTCNFSLKDIDGLLKRRLAPLEEEIERLSINSQKITLRDVISGLGYIMGIMGLWLYFLSRSKKSEK